MVNTLSPLGIGRKLVYSVYLLIGTFRGKSVFVLYSNVKISICIGNRLYCSCVVCLTEQQNIFWFFPIEDDFVFYVRFEVVIVDDDDVMVPNCSVTDWLGCH